MRFAILDGDTVVNVAEADGALAANWVQSDTAAIGDVYREGEFTRPSYADAGFIASRRYLAEVSGVTWGGFLVATDRESQNKISNEDRAVERGLRADGGGWKCLDQATGRIVFRPTSNQEIQDLAALVYAHVAACYLREDELLKAVEDGTFVDDMLEQGWP